MAVNINDVEREYIEIDFNNLELDKFYLVIHQDEMYAIRKISDHELATYDVIQQ